MAKFKKNPELADIHTSTWISVMHIWFMRIFPKLKRRMSQGPGVYVLKNCVYFEFCIIVQELRAFQHTASFAVQCHQKLSSFSFKDRPSFHRSCSE